MSGSTAASDHSTQLRPLHALSSGRTLDSSDTPGLFSSLRSMRSSTPCASPSSVTFASRSASTFGTWMGAYSNPTTSSFSCMMPRMCSTKPSSLR